MTGISIIGAGGHGKVVADTAAACGYAEIVFYDDGFPDRDRNGSWPVAGTATDAPASVPRFLAVGANAVRERLWQDLGIEASPVLADPRAVISPSAQLADGVLVVAGCVINADARIGRGAIINTASSIDHDCVIAAFAHVSPGAHLAGGVHVGERSWIGIGASVREGVRIGADVTVGAGACVIADVPDGARVAGVPARPFAGRT